MEKRKERIDAYFGLLRRLIWLRKQYCLCLPCIQLANFHQLGKKWDKRLSCYKSMEQLGLEGTSESHLIQPPAQAGLLRTSCVGPWSHGFVIPPRRETPHHLSWPFINLCHSSVTLTVKKFLWCSRGAFCVWPCAHWLRFHHWASCSPQAALLVAEIFQRLLRVILQRRQPAPLCSDRKFYWCGLEYF